MLTFKIGKVPHVRRICILKKDHQERIWEDIQELKNMLAVASKCSSTGAARADCSWTPEQEDIDLPGVAQVAKRPATGYHPYHSFYKLQWPREAKKWGIQAKHFVCSGMKATKIPTSVEIVYCNHDILKAWVEEFVRFDPATVICDGSQRVRQLKSGQGPGAACQGAAVHPAIGHSHPHTSIAVLADPAPSGPGILWW